MNSIIIRETSVPAPKVSVLGSCYNHEAYIDKAVRSILAQKGIDFELIVIDDASSDGSAKYLSSIDDPRVTVILHKKNRGISRTVNEAFALARGEYIAFMPGDDISYPLRLKLQTEFMDNNPDVLATFTFARTIDESGREAPRRTDACSNQCWTREQLLRNFFVGYNVLCAPTEVIRRSALDGEPYFYDPRNRQTQDLEQHLRFALKGDIRVLPKELLDYRWHQNNTSRGTDNVFRRAMLEYYVMLDSFLKADISLVVSFLPEIVQYGDIEQKTLPYFLARAAISCERNALKIWGFKTLADFFEDEANIDYIEKKTGFTLNDYYTLAGEFGG